MPNNIVFFISGKAASGKDTFFKHLPFKNKIKIPFADAVRQEYCKLNQEIDFERLCNDYLYKILHRQGLVDIGDGYRQVDKDIWVNKHTEILYDVLKKESNKIIGITDMRYQNEYDYAIQTQKIFTNDLILTIRMNASSIVRLARMSWQAAIEYRKVMFNTSETGLDWVPENQWDHFVDNDENVETENSLRSLFYIIQRDISRLFLKHPNHEDIFL